MPAVSNKSKLLKLIEYWFKSDLDIEFVLQRARRKILCIFESDVWYEHINDPVRDVTIKTIRHKGDHRRFIVCEGDDGLFEDAKGYCYKLYTEEELRGIVEDMAKDFHITWSWKD